MRVNKIILNIMQNVISKLEVGENLVTTNASNTIISI